MSDGLSLIQPRHVYAPAATVEPLGHIYMPTSLLAAAAIIMDSGIDVSILDENIEAHNYADRRIGINLLGPPYIPVAIRYSEALQKKYGRDFLLIVGGQVVSGLSAEQQRCLFGANAVNGNDTQALTDAIRGQRTGKGIEALSLIPAYSRLSDDYMRLYLTREFGFYLSQGCKHTCSFCTARRSIYDTVTNTTLKVKETYRDLDIASKDLEYLIQKATSLGIGKIDLYLSNLDLFQTPELLNAFAERVLTLRRNHGNCAVHMRALSNVRSFLKTHQSHPDIIARIIEAGLYRIGFGIDGATPQIWRETRKPQTRSECIDAIAVAKKAYNLVTEMLMVFGYNKCDSERSLELAYEFSKDMSERYGALPRPHVAKDVAPGNDGWRNPANQHSVEYLIDNPGLFQNLDFTALPSQYTHPDEELRTLVTNFYKKICLLPSSLTQYVKPEGTAMSERELSEVRQFNAMKYDI